MLDNKGFDLWADGYDRSVGLSDEENTYPFAGYKSVLATIYDAIRAGQGKRVLDIGFGTGVLTCKLYENGYDITGIDFSERMIQIAQEKMPLARLIRHDFTKDLPVELEEDKFDVIVCTYAIHHLNDAAKIDFLKELRTHLHPEGRIYIGDVAFATRAELEACRAQCGDEWDEEEFYVVADEIVGAQFEKISHCAGILMIQNMTCGMHFVEVTEQNIAEAGRIHSESWRESHRGFCSVEFIEKHTPAAQIDYLHREIAAGKHLYMLIAEHPVGIVSVHGDLIENLYVLPSQQGKGYGTQLLEFAMQKCQGVPRLWILNINEGAYRLYTKHGFEETGNRNQLNSRLYEMELVAETQRELEVGV